MQLAKDTWAETVPVLFEWAEHELFRIHRGDDKTTADLRREAREKMTWQGFAYCQRRHQYDQYMPTAQERPDLYGSRPGVRIGKQPNLLTHDSDGGNTEPGDGDFMAILDNGNIPSPRKSGLTVNPSGINSQTPMQESHLPSGQTGLISTEDDPKGPGLFGTAQTALTSKISPSTADLEYHIKLRELQNQFGKGPPVSIAAPSVVTNSAGLFGPNDEWLPKHNDQILAFKDYLEASQQHTNAVEHILHRNANIDQKWADRINMRLLDLEKDGWKTLLCSS